MGLKEMLKSVVTAIGRWQCANGAALPLLKPLLINLYGKHQIKPEQV
jgi:hypothetical protein